MPQKISFNQIEIANPTPLRIPGSPRMDNTPRTFGSVSQLIRNKIGRNHDIVLRNSVEYALDELTQFYNRSQAELATERENTQIAIDDAMSWQNTTVYILDEVKKTHKSEKLMHVFWRVYYENNTARLLSEIFALKILCNGYKNKAQSRARLYGKYTKWKNRARAKHAKYSKWKLKSKLIRDANLESEERINFLTRRILDLQNNNQHTGMAGYAPPKFRGLAGEDPAVFIRDLRQWCEASPNHNPNAGHQNRIRIDGLFEACLEDYAKDWYENEIKGRNWELRNISDNTGLANLGAINGLVDNNALRAINANQFRGGALHIRNTVPANNNAIANPLVPAHTVWDEDWSISGGRPTDLAPNAPNSNAGGNTIAAGIRIGQKIYHFLHDFPTVTAEKSKVAFQSIFQGTDTVGRFYAKLRRMVKLAYPMLPAVNQDELVKQQFFQGLSPDNQMESRRIGLETPLPALIRKLEEIERYKPHQLLGSTQPIYQAPVTTSQGITSAEIEKLYSKIASLQEQISQPTQINPQIPQKNEALEHLYILAQRLGCPQEMLNQKNVSTLNEYVTEELTRRLGVVEAFMAKASAVRPKKEPFPDPQIHVTKWHHRKSSQHRCSNCGKTGHNSRNCKKKKNKSSSSRTAKNPKSSRVNFVDVDSQSDSGVSESSNSTSDSNYNNSNSDDSSSESEAEINVNISREKKK